MSESGTHAYGLLEAKYAVPLPRVMIKLRGIFREVKSFDEVLVEYGRCCRQEHSILHFGLGKEVWN